MSLLNAIRDYTEFLNNFSDSVDLNVFQIIKFTLLYLVNSIGFVLFYLISFQWIKDISHLPILLPTLNSKILNEYYVLGNHLNLIELGPISSLEKNKLILGFLNAFFLALPISVPQLISIRRWLIQGSVAGLSSVIGFRVGQTLFFASILLGLRFLIVPWLSYEPLTYIIGFILLVNVIYEMTHENLVAIPQAQTSRHLKIFLLHFALAWTEQSALFQYFSNNSFSTNFTNLDIFVTLNNSEFWTSHCFYIIGLLIGGLFFDFVFLVGISNFIESLQIWLKIPLSTWKKQSNVWFLRFSLALSFASLPYYTLDYLFLGPLGAISQDKVVIQGADLLFTKNKFDGLRMGVEKVMFVDPFDRSRFLDTTVEGYEPSTFETRNFEGERAWEYAGTNKKANIADASQNTKMFARRLFNSSNLEENSKFERKSEILKEKPSKLFNLSEQFTPDDLLEIESGKPFNAAFFDRMSQDYFEPRASKAVESQDELFNVTSKYFPTFLNEDVKLYSREEAVIKDKFYSNPVYKNLLSVYVDSTLQQQPKDYFLTKTQEKQLYEARLALEDYYNSLRNYSNLSYWQQFQDYFGGTKGFSNKVYNQQFKGNLKVVRRLFGVTWNKEENPNELRKLSFDQTLYETTPSNFYHEELNLKNKVTQSSPINPMPFYAGWDNELRKFVISNRYLQREQTTKAAVTSSIPETSSQNPYSKLKAKNAFKAEFESPSTNFTIKEFSSWPLLSTEANSQNTFLFEPSQALKANKELLESLQISPDSSLLNQKLPVSIKFLSASRKPIFPPSRGGFMWPGENSLDFQNVVK
uniref:Hypothetical chloroplast RF1 n=1 Tax=Pedinomonas minor TaxID=3159 RepID=C7BES4_PEDMN|nr:hypothetical chloroplast RF1 [Pedinomonas minor]ACQ90901.1 hypothetical chloroplast RF1 [Pedinomonas minor]